jgi:hypothetical protein
MTLDELAARFETESDDPVVQKLGRLLLDWKTTDATVTDLVAAVERYVGTTWIASEAEHERVYGTWTRFRDGVISRIEGMTMNERLYHLSLFDRFDGSKADRPTIYEKLLAEP